MRSLKLPPGGQTARVVFSILLKNSESGVSRTCKAGCRAGPGWPGRQRCGPRPGSSAPGQPGCSPAGPAASWPGTGGRSTQPPGLPMGACTHRPADGGWQKLPAGMGRSSGTAARISEQVRHASMTWGASREPGGSACRPRPWAALPESADSAPLCAPATMTKGAWRATEEWGVLSQV